MISIYIYIFSFSDVSVVSHHEAGAIQLSTAYITRWGEYVVTSFLALYDRPLLVHNAQAGLAI